MRVVIVGGSGHVGTYLVPRLVEAGYEVINLTRGKRDPYQPHAAWRQVQTITADRDAEDAAGTFGSRVRDLKPDIVIDMICFSLPSAVQIAEALRGRVTHFLHCGTIWAHGASTVVPATESLPRFPFGEYGIQKNAIESYLLDEARRGNLPATVIMPGHIVGPGWNPLNPQGNFNPQVFEVLARGEELALPNLGLETVHHVHADDVAQAFQRSIEHWSTSVGESFHTVSEQAITLRGYAQAVAGWFNQEARLTFQPFETWRTTVSEADAAQTLEHIGHSPNASIAKARQHIDYQPRYSSLQSIYEAVNWMIANQVIQISK
ncbi:MAG: NAD-dependent epimerase/dehydratase family protein [Anaerolineae bacterium]